jgi:hypothetical protein
VIKGPDVPSEYTVRYYFSASLFYDPTNDRDYQDNLVLDQYVIIINLLLAVGAKNPDGNWTTT